MDNETKHDLLDEMARWLEENGLFVVRKHGYVEGWCNRYSPRFLIRIDPDSMKLLLHQSSTAQSKRIFDLHDPETFPMILAIIKGSNEGI